MALAIPKLSKLVELLNISGRMDSTEMNNAVKTVYDELDKTLKAYGLSFQHVVKENVFTTNIDGFIQQQELRKKYYKGDFLAASWVQVGGTATSIYQNLLLKLIDC